MRRIDFLITNPNHHFQLIFPVIEALQKNSKIKIRVLSLCEFRRMRTPVEILEKHGINYHILPGFTQKNIKPSAGQKSLGKYGGLRRTLAHTLLWHFYLKRAFVNALNQTDEVFLLNDFAFPNNYITATLNRRGIPFYLLQEGIRFPLPNEKHQEGGYGCGGAQIIFAWGTRSQQYFQSLQPNDTHTKVVAAGCPRYDNLLEEDFEVAIQDLKSRYIFGSFNLGLFSNPIDDQGFCRPEQKLLLIEKFIQRTLPLLRDIDGKIIIKLHPRESSDTIQRLIHQHRWNNEVILIDGNLFALLKLVNVSVLMASTVGLESLLMNTPIGILSIPDYGYVFDYVSNGGGVALNPQEENFENQLQQLLSQAELSNKSKEYITDQFHRIGQAGPFIARQLIEITNSNNQCFF